MRSRWLLVLLALVGVLLAACGGGDGGAERSTGDGPAASGVGSTTTTTAPVAEGSCPAGVNCADGGSSSGPPITATGPATTARTSTTRPPTSAPTTTGGVDAPSGPPATAPMPGSGDVRPTATDDGSQGPPGAFARTLLRPQPATAIVLERAAQAGASTAQASVDRSARILGQVTGKPVDIRPVGSVASRDTDWSADEVRAAADAAATTPQGGERAVLRLLVLKGTFEGSADVLGVAVRGDVLALFVDSIAGAATPLVGRSTIEDAVLLHELGHLLGLVDLARDTGRADKDRPGHSSNRDSVMYWAVESDLIGQVFGGPPPRDFDAADLADLQALRNGA